MRRLFATVAAAIVLTGGAGGGEAAEPLARWHFAGAESVSADPNGVLAKGVLRQPLTAQLTESALTKLARAPKNLFRGATIPPGAPPALRPLLDDLLRCESLGLVREGGWGVAVRLTPDMASRWQAAWGPLLASWGAVTTQANGGWEARWSGSAPVARLERQGDWTVIGSDLEVHRELTRGLKGGQPAPLAGTWMVADVDLPRLAPVWGLPSDVTWPLARIRCRGRGENLRTEASLRFTEPLNLALEPWQIPTNSIREPLVSFLAMQGFGTWLERQSWFKELGIAPTPSQAFGWSQGQIPFQVYASWRWPGAAAALSRLVPRLAGVATNAFPAMNLGPLADQIVHQTDLNRVAWERLPLIVPFVEVAKDDPGFAVAGVFPVHSERPTAPPALYSEVLGRTNLAFYHWEITQNRTAAWQHLNRFQGMLSRYAPPSTNALGFRWLQETNILASLGNTVTEITVVSPRELAVTRSSAVGFTGYELNRLVTWLDDPAFPRRSPPQPAGAGRRSPANVPPSPVSPHP
ncbi:MAG: hypothetical protein ACYDC1_13600 [Limisphaerales bacterium]